MREPSRSGSRPSRGIPQRPIQLHQNPRSRIPGRRNPPLRSRSLTRSRITDRLDTPSGPLPRRGSDRPRSPIRRRRRRRCPRRILSGFRLPLSLPRRIGGRSARHEPSTAEAPCHAMSRRPFACVVREAGAFLGPGRSHHDPALFAHARARAQAHPPMPRVFRKHGEPLGERRSNRPACWPSSTTPCHVQAIQQPSAKSRANSRTALAPLVRTIGSQRIASSSDTVTACRLSTTRGPTTTPQRTEGPAHERHPVPTPALYPRAARPLPRRARPLPTLQLAAHARHAMGGRSRHPAGTRRARRQRQHAGALLALPWWQDARTRRPRYRKDGAYPRTPPRRADLTKAPPGRQAQQMEEDGRRAHRRTTPATEGDIRAAGGRQP